MNSIVKLGLNLFAICAVAALLLGVTNQVTAPVIAERNVQANNESRQMNLLKFQIVNMRILMELFQKFMKAKMALKLLDIQ